MKFARLLVVPVLLLAAACHDGKPAANVAGVTSAKNGAALGFALQESPLSLTASDGTGLKLTSMRANAVVDGGLAFTELRLAFENPLDRVLEGTFRVSLPAKASLGRFAMLINKEWQEGEVVELGAARRAYEDFLHRKQDPALMEKAAGNEFSARVFPIPARGTKELIVAWVEEVEHDRYVLPLRGLPELGTLEADVTVRGAKTASPHLHESNVAPQRDFVVDLPKETTTAKVSAIRNGELALVRVRPQTDTKPDPLASTIILVDTSASRALGFENELGLVTEIARKAAEAKGSVTVACFDQRVTEVYRGKAADFGEPALAKLRAHGALGASDLERALAWAKDTAQKAGAKRVVLVTDGVATAGANDTKALQAKVAALRSAGVERIDAVAVGGIRDDEGLLRLVRGNLARDGVVAQASDGDATRRLAEATRSNVPVKVEGANWSWPAKLDGVQAGDTFSVYVELAANKPLKVSVGDAAVETISPRVTERPLLERAVAQAQVASMLERQATAEAKTAESLKKSIVSLATRNRILTPYTAMLVLETEQDYARFGIDRRSPSAVLAIEDGNVRQLRREPLAVPTDIQLPAESPRKTVAGKPMAKAPAAAMADDPTMDMKQGAPGAPMDKDEGSPAPAAQAAPPLPRIAQAESMEKKADSASVSRAAAGGAPAPARRPVARPRPAPTMAPSPASPAMEEIAANEPSPRDDSGPAHGKPAYEGRFATVMQMIAAKQTQRALDEAFSWHAESPGDVLALVAIGEAAEASGDLALAERAYGSIIDLFANRADLRRFAGERLERVGMKDPAALELAVDAFTKALADRPDHPGSHRLLTFALVRQKQYARAFENAVTAVHHRFDTNGRFRGVDRILAEDVGLVGAAWSAAEPNRRTEIEDRIRTSGGRLENEPSLRFVLNWETDANDVDFHIHDSRGGHAYYSAPNLPSGGNLYADVTTGYGPECFTIRSPQKHRVGPPGLLPASGGPYHLEAHYYSRGPMGYGMGKLEVIEHDGKGGLRFEERPFLVMVDQAYVDLGNVE